MNKLYSQDFYTNPFRYRKFDNRINQTEVLEGVKNNIKPFLGERFEVINDYIDELGNFKPEVKIIRFLREKLKRGNKILNPSLDNFEKYNVNLRYLELPLQPKVDKKGFEVQFLSNEILDDTIEEIDEGFSYIYDYCSQMFPESMDLWNDYVNLNPNDFPFAVHDSILESTYEIFDKIFDNLQKNSLNFFGWVISGDLNKSLLKIIKPKFTQTRINSLFIILESLLSLTLVLLIMKYILLKSNSIIKVQNQTLKNNPIHSIFSEIRKDFNFKRFRIQQKNKKIKSKIISFKNRYKYKVLKLISGNEYS